MSTGTTLVKRALSRIGANSIVQPATGNTINDAFEVLKSMIQLWESWGIDLGVVPLEVVGDDLSEPPDSTNAIINNLALELAPDFSNGKQVISPALVRQANMDFWRVETLYQTFTVPNKVVSKTLPVGQGNSKGIYRRTFFGPNATVSD